MSDREKDEANLEAALAIVREHCPGAVAIDLETSDQGRYGFVLTGVERPDGSSVAPEDALPMEPEGVINDLLSDIDWDGVVGEDSLGYARIELNR